MRGHDGALSPLTKLGLTSQELALYYALLAGGSLSGYEAAREAGISRANAYQALSSLAAKGFAHATDDDTPRHSALAPREAVALARKRFEAEARLFLSRAPARRGVPAPFLTVSGRERVLERMAVVLEAARDRAYLACPTSVVEELRVTLTETARRIKLVLITDKACGIAKAVEHTRAGGGERLRLIVDGARVLTGQLGALEARCVFSENAELVALIKESLTNEIELLRRKS
jgi:HTH-type transcriptional regulator, sugar sensing transcriptional regulator